MAHSLVRDHIDSLQSAANGTFRLKVTRNPGTGERQQRLVVDLPHEEQFESFAARLRPFTMRDEPVYWALVLDAIETLAPDALLNEVIDIQDLRNAYAEITSGNSQAQAYSVITENGQLTDLQIANLWLYSDALHAKAISSAVGNDISLDERFRAAAGVYARLGAAVNATYNVVSYLAQEGAIELAETVFTDPVIARTTIDVPITRAFSAPVGSAAPMPIDLDDPMEIDPAWRPLWEDIEELIGAQQKESVHRCPERPGAGGIKIRWPQDWLKTEQSAPEL